jgi:CMP-N-acetylneuraminic acid synthetase
MKVLGIVCAKAESSRFPGKNKYVYDGAPLFWHSVRPLLESKLVDDVYVATDSDDIAKYCKKNDVGIVFRGVNANLTDEPLMGVLNYCIKSINKKYDVVVTIMANCPNHSVGDVDNAITKFKNNNELKEVRGFDALGIETGLLLFDSNIVMSNFSISSHIGSVLTEGYEVHYKVDLI